MRSVTALLILTAAVGACGGAAASPSHVAQAGASGSAPSTAPAAPTDATAATAATAATSACALLTEAEATAFLGSDPGPGNDTGSAGSPACAYGASLTMGVESTDAKATYDARKGAMAGSGKAQAIDGVGDAAFVFIVADTIAQMAILKGSDLLTVNVQGDPSLKNITLERLTALATTMASRL